MIFLLTLPILWYIYERVFNHHYEFTRIFDVDRSYGLKFLDLPFALGGISLSVLIVNRLTETRPATINDLIIDVPLTLLEHDDYERGAVYEGLLKQLSKLNFESNKSFCIGVANTWGEGKTSFLNFLERRLKDDNNTIVIKFNPWFSRTGDGLTIDFFQTLDKELSKYTYTGSSLRKYANNLTLINSVFNPFKYLPVNWINEKSNQKSFDDINLMISRIYKRIFIFIDDVDRLDNAEVFNVMRNIRNTASFTNTHFVVPFDKNYVIQALTENKIHKPEEYIKKIFDVEVTLPPIAKDRLQRVLYGLFEDFFSNKIQITEQQKDEYLLQLNRIVFDQGYIFNGEAKYSVANNFIFSFIKTKRDIIRYFNCVILSIQSNLMWVYLPDLIILESIKYYNTDVYRMLFENDHYLFKKQDILQRQYYQLLSRKTGDGLLEGALNKRRSDFHLVDRISKDTELLEVVKQLFHLPPEKDFNAKYAFAYTTNLANYFQYRENGISYEELENILNEQEPNT